MMKLLLILTVSCISLSDACSCFPSTIPERFCASQFAGIITVLTSDFGCGINRCYGISVVQQIRGTPITPDLLQTAINSAVCGVWLIPGHKYFVAARTVDSNTLELSLCQLSEDWTLLSPLEIETRINEFSGIECNDVSHIKLEPGFE